MSRTAAGIPAPRATSVPCQSSRRNGGSNALDRKAPEIIVGLGRIEFLAHYFEALRPRRRRLETNLFHQLSGVGGQIDLFGHGFVIDVALDLPPALHLGQDPDRKRLPGERIEIDAVGIALHIAE